MSVAFELKLARGEDLEELVALRIEAMRESLLALGRFDPKRARERLASQFDAACTRHIEVAEQRVGFFVVKERDGEWWLEHFYVRPSLQGRGLGSAVLSRVLAEADARGLSVTLTALRGSAANRFYQRHGFVQVGESEWDVHYRRDAAPKR